MIEFVLSLLLQFSVLQSGGVKTTTPVNETKSTTQTTTTTPTTGTRIGSGGWDEKN